ncbi:MAG: hypothetical protein A2X56_11610 [Nitrospirae bacterium GWC2_57_13]|nr:MAG: hypothetical protein A2072_03645 [Nitrospirae bacterium GWC1_57_7]OGW27503.1 MAG: hypothetical protein A2X56_11610 [Nitrospirae bacterium GWC2_57_13]
MVLSHGQKHCGMLGKLVANAKKATRAALLDQYFATLMDGLRPQATVRKNTNVLQHMAGYFKEMLPKEEKQELQEVIRNYHEELVLRIVPITLIRHYVKKYKVEYLQRQYCLNPYPLELMLRNHV